MICKTTPSTQNIDKELNTLVNDKILVSERFFQCRIYIHIYICSIEINIIEDILLIF